MKIVLAGASGNLGLALTQCLLGEGHAVVAVDANIQRLEPFRGRLAGLHALDLRSPDALQGIMNITPSESAVDLVITTVGIGRPKKLSDYQEVDYQANLNLLNAAGSAGVRRFIYTSVVQVDSDLSVPLLKAKYAFEVALRESSLQWLIIRPSGYFTDIWRTFMGQAQKGRINLIRTDRPFRFTPIHPDDVASFVARNLNLAGQSIMLGGPQDFTYAEISQLCFELLSKPAQIQATPLPVFNILLACLRLINPPVYGVMSFLRWASTTDLTAPHVGSRPIREYLMEKLNKK
jgi:uncharacterized protein YbjT (DUF2867 family)